jgi:hypothetical protein
MPGLDDLRRNGKCDTAIEGWISKSIALVAQSLHIFNSGLVDQQVTLHEAHQPSSTSIFVGDLAVRPKKT